MGFMMMTFSCSEELVEKVIVDPSSVVGGEIQELTNSNIVLTYAEANDNIDSIFWESTDYGFSTSVTYALQIDIATNDFANAQDLALTTGLAATANVEDLNDMLVGTFGLTPEVSSDLEFRVVSSIDGEFGDVVSAPMAVSIMPYNPDIPPIYLVGDGQGWDMGNAVELSSIAPLQYLGFADFAQNQTFRLFEFNDWDNTGTQWGYSYFEGGVASEFEDNGDADSNFIFTSDVVGTYSVTVDLNAQTVVIEKQLFPSTLYIVGDDQGWSLDDANGMLHRGGGVFETYETLNNGSWWRFFETPSWGATQWNFNTFADGNIDELLTGTTEGDANFQFIGETGIYKITVSTLDLTIDIEPAEAPTMYLVGGDNGWTFGSSMTWIRGHRFSETITLTEGNEWRFFPAFEVWGNTFNYNHFGEIDGALWTGPNGGDANFLNLVSGSYTITMDAGGIGTVSGAAQ